MAPGGAQHCCGERDTVQAWGYAFSGVQGGASLFIGELKI